MFIRNPYLYSIELERKEMFYLTLFSAFKGMCHYLETFNRNIGGVNVYKGSTGADRERAFFERTELSKQSCLVTRGCT